MREVSMDFLGHWTHCDDPLRYTLLHFSVEGTW